MRDYQIRGLNWLLGLDEHGINGILADEMVRFRCTWTFPLHGLHFKGVFNTFLGAGAWQNTPDHILVRIYGRDAAEKTPYRRGTKVNFTQLDGKPRWTFFPYFFLPIHQATTTNKI